MDVPHTEIEPSGLGSIVDGGKKFSFTLWGDMMLEPAGNYWFSSSAEMSQEEVFGVICIKIVDEEWTLRNLNGKGKSRSDEGVVRKVVRKPREQSPWGQHVKGKVSSENDLLFKLCFYVKLFFYDFSFFSFSMSPSIKMPKSGSFHFSGNQTVRGEGRAWGKWRL